jgi:hypothetical protein
MVETIGRNEGQKLFRMVLSANPPTWLFLLIHETVSTHANMLRGT